MARSSCSLFCLVVDNASLPRQPPQTDKGKFVGSFFSQSLCFFGWRATKVEWKATSWAFSINESSQTKLVAYDNSQRITTYLFIIILSLRLLCKSQSELLIQRHFDLITFASAEYSKYFSLILRHCWNKTWLETVSPTLSLFFLSPSSSLLQP